MSQQLSKLQDLLSQVKAVLNETQELQPSPVVFDADDVPDTVRHGSYRLVAGPIQANVMSRADGMGTLCSEKTRLLFIYIAAKNLNNEQEVYEDLVRLEELIEQNLLKDPRTSPYFHTLQNVETAPDADNLFWVMEMVFEFEYQRNF